MTIKKQNYNPCYTHDEKRWGKFAKDIGEHIADGYIIDALKNAYAEGYNKALENVEKEHGIHFEVEEEK